jgi:hypothetical protein
MAQSAFAQMSTPLTEKAGGHLLDAVERRSRLVTLVYQVLGTVELPPVDASEGEVLAALAIAFHRQSSVALEAERSAPQSKPRLPEYAMFSLSRR